VDRGDVEDEVRTQPVERIAQRIGPAQVERGIIEASGIVARALLTRRSPHPTWP
jgi:hypothetical protein